MAESEVVLKLRIAARPEALREVRDRVHGCVARCGCSSPDADDIVIAIDEACQNIIRHAYGGDADGEIELEIERRGPDIVVSILDFAPPIDPERVRPRPLDELRPGGLGTHLIRQLMDRTEFARPPSGRGNLLRMTKRIE